MRVIFLHVSRSVRGTLFFFFVFRTERGGGGAANRLEPSGCLIGEGFVWGIV